MSVINKMLRDLDNRQTGTLPGRPMRSPAESSALMRGTSVVGSTNVATRSLQRRTLIGSGTLLLLLLAGLSLWWFKVSDAGRLTKPELPVMPRTPASVPGDVGVDLVVPGRVASAPLVPGVPAATAKSSAAPAAIARPLVVTKPTGPSPANSAGPPHQRADGPVSEKLSLRLSSNVPVPPAPPASAARSPASAMAGTALPSQSNVSAEMRAQASSTALVAQAQALWNDGSRSAAIGLLKGALESFMHMPAPANPLEAAPVAVLAREYARVTLASGQPGELLATLERLEPRLAGVADIWAIRANAAQRLGRHAQAVAAYQQALVLRPEEPRWMLGLAVSLAAGGQTGPAAEWAEKARSAKALPADVAHYLRELGVAVRSD